MHSISEIDNQRRHHVIQKKINDMIMIDNWLRENFVSIEKRDTGVSWRWKSHLAGFTPYSESNDNKEGVMA